MNAHDLFATVAFLNASGLVISLIGAVFVWLVRRTDPQ